jgi:hypothetical protein
MPVAQQFHRFTQIFEELLLNLSRKKMDSYILMDANIDLLKLNTNASSNYFYVTVENIMHFTETG